MRIAALFLIIAGAAILYYVLNSDQKIKNITAHADNKILKDTLPDGSVITLNKNASLVYPEKFKGDTRSVSLTGEAFFEISPNKEKPFVIGVNDVMVKVVGTSFNIRSSRGTTEVIVESGIVQVTRHHKTVELRHGQSCWLTCRTPV
jgi:ferric-dicitrate binding protein FerR (iron transport regulator)